jgi:membrane protein required for colicin V production
MEPYDLIMLAVVAAATFFGFIKGFAWQVASLASLVVSYFCALRFADQLAPMIHDDPRWNKYAAMLVIYAGTSLAVWMLFRGISGTIDRMKLREFDRQMGGLLGLAKGVLLATVVTFFAVTLTEQSRAAVLRSKSGVYIAEFLHKAEPIMPPELKGYLDPYLLQLEQGLNPNQQVQPTVPTNLPTNLPVDPRNIPMDGRNPFNNPQPQPYPPGYPQQPQPAYPNNGGAMYAPPGGYPPPGNYVQPSVYAPGQPAPYNGAGQPNYQPAMQPNFQPPR